MKLARTVAPLTAALAAWAWALAAYGGPDAPRVAAPAPLAQLEGSWLLRGRSSDAGSFSGRLRFEARPGGTYRYERVVQDPRGRLERETGEALVRGGQVFTRTATPDGPGILQGLELEAPGRTGSRRVARYQLHPSGDRLEGRFLVTGTLRHGVEELVRDATGLANNDVRLLVDGPEAFPAIYAELRGARQQICVQTFSWFDDRAGRYMADLLRAKVREGVEVRCLVDAFPQSFGWKTGDYLREGGVDVRLHHGAIEGVKNSVGGLFRGLWNGIKRLFGAKPQPREKRGILNHDHRKLIVVDGRVAFTGGMNIGDKYEQGTTWHDVHARVEGSAVTELEALFWERWRAAGGEGRAAPPLRGDLWPGELRVEVLQNLPGLRSEVTDRYIQEIDRARREILVENPYFLYDPVVDGLQAAARRGVRTVVIVPDNDQNDEALARDAMYWIQNDIVRSGVALYKYEERMCHGKVAVWDRRLATVGTTNLDMFAMVHNAEVNLFVPEAAFAQEVKQRVFDADIPNSRRIRVEKLSWWEKVKGGTMYMLRAFL